MDFFDLLKVFRNRWMIWTLIPFLAAIITFVATLSIKRNFKSKSLISTGITVNKELNLTGDALQLQPFMVANEFSSFTEQMKSRVVINQLSYQLAIHDLQAMRDKKEAFRDDPDFDKDWVDANKLFTTYLPYIQRKYDSLSPLITTYRQDYIVDKVLEGFGYDYQHLMEKVKSDRLGTSDYIFVEVESENPHLSAFIANSWCTEYIRYQSKLRLEEDASKINFYRSSAQQKREALTKVQNELAKYKELNSISNIEEQTKSLIERISERQIDREKFANEIPALQSKVSTILAMFNSRKPKYLEGTASDENKKVSILQDQIKVLVSKKVGMSDEVRRAEIEDSISVLRKAINAKTNENADQIYVNPNATRQQLVGELNDAQLRIQQNKKEVQKLDEELADLREQQNAFAPKEAELRRLENEVKVASDAYAAIQTKEESAIFSAGASIYESKLIERAIPAAKAEPSKRLLLVILSFVASFVLCMLGIVIAEYLDNAVKTTHRFNIMTKVSAIAAIPFVEDVPEWEAMLHDQMPDHLRNAFRQLRTSLMRQHADKKVWLLASTSRNVGKTWLRMGWASAVAKAGRRVLIIDSDINTANLTQRFGLKSFINPPNDSVGNPQRIAPGVYALGVHPKNGTPAEVFNTTKLQEVFKGLSQYFDFILIEAEDALEQVAFEEWLAVADAFMLVVDAGQSLNTVERFWIFEASQHAKYGGVVLNRTIQWP